MDVPALAQSPSSRGLVRSSLTRLLSNPPGLVGLIIIVTYLLVASLGPLFTPYDPLKGSLSQSLQPPSISHLMGTDILGRDMLSRVVVGARISLLVGVSSIGISVLIGCALGVLAAGLGGWVDSVVMRTTDVFLAIPGILLAIGIVAWLNRGLPQITLAVAASNAPVFTRLLRGSLLRVQNADFVTAARGMGCSRVRLMGRHMLPNALTPVAIQATLSMGLAIISVAGLGFLGLGPPDPSTPEWGTMLTNASDLTRAAPYLILFPSLAIVLVVIGFNLLGDGLREALDPRLRR